jgi:hypothetical protein
MMMCTFIFYFLINSAAFSQTSQCQSNLIMTTTTDFMPPLTAIPFGTPFTITTVVRNTGSTPQNVSLQLRLSSGSQPLFEVLCADDYSWNGNIGQRSFQVPARNGSIDGQVVSRMRIMYILDSYGASPQGDEVHVDLLSGGSLCPSVADLSIPSRYPYATPLGVPGQTTTVNAISGRAIGSLIIRGTVILNFNHILEPVGNGGGVIFPFIYMDEGATLVIPSGRTLTLKGARVFGIRSMWNSIIVEPGGSLITGLGSDLSNTFIRRTSIKDGIIAIEARNGSNINVSYTDFEDNERSIYVPPTTGALQTVNFGSAFPVCDFNGTGQLRPKPNLPILNCNTDKINGYPFAAMDINDLGSLITVISPSFSGAKTQFRNMSNGIVAQRARLYVDQAVFTNLKRTYSGFDGLGIYIRDPNSSLSVSGNPNQFAPVLEFANCSQGIVCENLGLNDGCSISTVHMDNTADDVGVGIRVVNNNFCQSYIGQNNIKAKIGILSAWNRFNVANVGQISFNLIESSNPADPVNSVGILGYENSTTGNWNISNNNINVQSAAFGMLSYSGNGAFITNNTISMQSYSHVNATGIYTSGGSNLNASCNNILGAGLGGGAYRSAFVISGGLGSSCTCNNMTATEVGFNIVGETRPFAMSANRFNNHSVGLVVNDASFIGIQALKGNKWQGPFVRVGAEHNDPIPNNVRLSKFEVGNSNIPILPTFNASASDWFIVRNGTDATCTSLNACPNGNPAGRVAGSSPVNNDAFYRSAMSAERVQSPHAEEMKWTTQRNAYGRLMDNPSEQNSREITAFVSNMRNTSTGQLYQVEKEMKDAQGIGQEFNDVLLANANTIKTLANEIADLDAKIFIATGAAKTALLVQKKEKNATIHRLSSENAPRHASIESRRKQQFQQLMRNNDRISTRLQPEINEKEVNRIYMETVAQGKMVLNREQAVTARAIAFQCPSLGGNAVFAARSLYSLVENVNFDDLALCNARSEPIQGLAVKRIEANFKISPNPATEMLVVSQSSEQAEAGEWLIFDTAGKLMRSHKVSEKEIESTINIQPLSEGIYFVSFSVNGQKRYTQKLVKIKSN